MVLKKLNKNIWYFVGKKSNDKSNPDYVPSVNMGYSDKTDAELRAGRHNRFQRREAEKEKQEAASILVDLSENVPPVEQGNIYVQTFPMIINTCTM